MCDPRLLDSRSSEKLRVVEGWVGKNFRFGSMFWGTSLRLIPPRTSKRTGKSLPATLIIQGAIPLNSSTFISDMESWNQLKKKPGFKVLSEDVYIGPRGRLGWYPYKDYRVSFTPSDEEYEEWNKRKFI